MGFLIIASFGAAALALLIALGVRKPLWSLAGATVMFGATGYALQGSPRLGGRPTLPDTQAAPVDPGLLDLRDRMLGRAGFSADGAYLIAADAMERVGERRAAVQAVIGGLRRYGNSLILWIGLGDTLAQHDGGRVSPPALFAFQQAMRVSPAHPAPPFFLGLAYVRAGEFAAARPYWARALALAPVEASYHRDIAIRLALLDQYLAEAERD